MSKKLFAIGLLMLCASLGWAQPSQAADMPSVTLGISSWIGYGPIFIADEKGFFKQEGVDVKLRRIEKVADRRSALAAGAIMGFPTTVDTQVSTAAAGVPVVQVVALDDSYGADGIVARKDINSIEDLKGKDVGLETGGGASFFWFLNLLNEHDMTLDDINVKDMSAGAAGAAFAAGRLQAAVTWQPWLSTAEDTDFGHVVISSKQTPGVIADTLALRRDYVQDNPQTVQAIVNGVLDAMAYIETHQDDAYAIMAKAMGQTQEDFADVADGVRFYGLDKNLSYFGTADDPGPLYTLSSNAEKLYLETGIISEEPDINTLIDPSFVHQAADR